MVEERHALRSVDLIDGSTLIDRGDSIALRGRLTWQAALETAAAAERHGWTEVRVSGDRAYKDAVTVAAMLRGLKVLNHELSPKARAGFERLMAEQAARQGEKIKARSRHELSEYDESCLRRASSRELHQKLAKRFSGQETARLAESHGENSVPELKPRKYPYALHR